MGLGVWRKGGVWGLGGQELSLSHCLQNIRCLDLGRCASSPPYIPKLLHTWCWAVRLIHQAIQQVHRAPPRGAAAAARRPRSGALVEVLRLVQLMLCDERGSISVYEMGDGRWWGGGVNTVVMHLLLSSNGAQTV